MSKENLVQVQRFLIIAVLFLLCVVLALFIFNKYQSTQKIVSQNKTKERNLSFLTPTLPPVKTADENVSNPFKRIYYENIDINQSENLEQNQSKDYQNSFTQEQNLSLPHQSLFKSNLSQDLNQSIQKLDQNLSFSDLNQSKIEDENLSSKKDLNSSVYFDNNSKKAKLVIIIDDMANAQQAKKLKALNLKLIPSFFPPDKTHKNTPQLALSFDFYMVHLPLAPLHYKKIELDTLNPNDSEERILKKIEQIKKDFKGLKFINNHTGSLFTSDKKAMRKLYKALIKENLVFVDSKTIENTEVSKVAKEMGQIYIQRDIFLDNKDDIAYIKKQLSNAVKIAQKKGFAIVIGHPRKNTFKALEESKALLKSVKLVYLSEIYGE